MLAKPYEASLIAAVELLSEYLVLGVSQRRLRGKICPLLDGDGPLIYPVRLKLIYGLGVLEPAGV